MGARNYKSATATIASSIALFLGIGIVMSLAVPFSAGYLAELMNAPLESFTQTVNYITICGIGILAIIFFNVISGMFRGIGDSKSPFRIIKPDEIL